jgi:hypothetical protein
MNNFNNKIWYCHHFSILIKAMIEVSIIIISLINKALIFQQLNLTAILEINLKVFR